MSIPLYDTFDGLAGPLVDHAGQVGAAWSRHPAHAAAIQSWSLSGLGSAYASTTGYESKAVYLASGVPDAADFDLRAGWTFKSTLGDSGVGVIFLAHATDDTYWRLLHDAGSNQWQLALVIGGGVDTAFGTYADAVTAGAARKVLIEVRVVAGSTTATVKIDGTTRITGTSATATGGNRVGLYAFGTGSGSPTASRHLDRLMVGSAAFVPPDYDLSGPASVAPGAESGPFTVALSPGVNPGSVTVTPSVTGLVGTFSPASVTLADAARSATFTFTPDATPGNGTISVADSGTLADPPAMPFASVLGPPARLAAWRAFVPDCHSTGAHPYLPGAGTYMEGAEHYDPIVCMYHAQDYFVQHGLSPADWSVQIAAGIDRYRDYIIASNTPPQLHHVNTTGVCRHWYEAADPLDITGLDLIFAGTGDAANFLNTNRHMGVARETSYKLMGSVDREWAARGEHPLLDATAECCLGYIDQWTASPGTYWGIWCKPWMAGLVMRSLIAYWDRYRGTADANRAALVAQVPGRIKACCDYIWASCWYPAGTPANFGGSSNGWDKGALKYVDKPITDPSIATITGLTIQTVTDSKTFTGPASLSAVDGYYKYAAFGFADPATFGDGAAIHGYDGATRTFHLDPLYGPQTLTPGTAFEIKSPGTESDMGPTPEPALNHMASPGFAWSYWHEKVVLGNPAGAIRFRVRHDALFDGASQSWGGDATSQKSYNQSLLWVTKGLEWRDRGDSEWADATSFSLQAPATGASGAASAASAPFRLSIAHGVKLADPCPVTPSTSTGLGAFAPPAGQLLLTTDRPMAPFTLAPAAADSGTTIAVASTATGLTAPAGVAYAVDAAPSGALTAGAASFVSSGTAGISVTSAAATGGTGPYTYAWQRQSDGGSFSALVDGGGVSGATTLSLVDGSAVAGVLYGYRLVSTDSAAPAATATGATVSAQLYAGGAIGAGASTGAIADAVWAHATAAALIARDDIGLADAVTGGVPTTAAFRGSDALSASDGFYVGSWLAPVSGPLKGQARKVAAYAGSTRTFTFAVPWPAAPADATPFVLFGHSN